MNNLMYHVAKPENSNSLNSYGEFSTIDFSLNVSGRNLVANSIRIEGDIRMTTDGNTQMTTQELKMDNRLGAHVFFDSFSITSPQSKGLLQNAQQYQRYAKSVMTATMGDLDVCDAGELCELKGVHSDNGRVNLQQQADFTNNGNLRFVQPSFSIKPLICLNQSVAGGGSYSFDKYGEIRISTNLARSVSAVFGIDNDANAQYFIENIVIRYMTKPADPSDNSKMLMNSYSMIKNSISSTASNVSCYVPSQSVSGVTINFLNQDAEKDPNKNSFELNKYPNFLEASYNFSDASNTYVSYTITQKNDLLRYAIESLRSAGFDSVSFDNVVHNDSYIAGLSFNGQFVDMTKNKFALNLKASQPIGSQFIYLYFHTLIAMT